MFIRCCKQANKNGSVHYANRYPELPCWLLKLGTLESNVKV